MAADRSNKKGSSYAKVQTRRSRQTKEFHQNDSVEKVPSKGSDTEIDVPFASLEVSKTSEMNREAMKAIKKYKSKSKARMASRRGLTTAKPTQLQELLGSSGDELKNITPPVFKKKKSEMSLIRSALAKNFFFDNMTVLEMNQLIDAFEPISVSKGAIFIQQGSEGDFAYIVQEGLVTFQVNGKTVGQAGAGTSFGELALLYACPRAATVLAASEPTKLFRVDQKTFQALLQNEANKSETQKIQLLQSLPMFEGIGLKDLRKLGRAMTPRIVEKGHTFYNQGEPADEFFVVQEGKINVHGKVIDSGDCFGEDALCSTAPRDHSAAAVSDGVVFSIGSATFEKILGNVSKLTAKSRDRQTLACLPMFIEAGLQNAQLEELAHLITDETFQPGTKFFDDGRKTDATLYLIRQGSVQLSGARNILVTDGGVFGEEQLLLDAAHSGVPDITTPSTTIAKYSATAMSQCVCGVLTLLDCRTVFDTSKMIDPDSPLPDDEDEAAMLAAAAMAPTLGRETTQQWLESSSKEGLRSCIRNNVELDDLQKHSILGEGQFGKVWLVSTDLGYNQIHHFALKAQKKHDKSRKNSIREIKAEIKVLGVMDHPYIVSFLHQYEDKDNLYILMGLVHGGELFDVIHQQGDDGLWYSGINEADAKFYAMVVSDTLNYIHQKQYVFRDLKPENILIDKDGYPIIVDFGFAKFAPDKTYTLCGTPNYLSPEVILHRGHGACSDHWALGIVVYEMLAGENPFYNDGMDQISLFAAIVQDDFYPLPNDISDDAFYFIDELLEKDPAKRLGSLAGGGKDIVRHQWFDTLDIVKLRQKKHKAPFKPSNPSLETLIEETSLLENSTGSVGLMD